MALIGSGIGGGLGLLRIHMGTGNPLRKSDRAQIFPPLKSGRIFMNSLSPVDRAPRTV
jgi:hypothetical protein